MRLTALLTLLALLLSPLSPSSASPSAVQPLPAPQLRLHRGTFDAAAPAPVAPTPEWAASAPGPYAILQLRGPITPADRAALEPPNGAGVSLLEYLPDYAYLVRGTPEQIDAAARLPLVYARTPFTLADKLAPSLLRALARGDADLGTLRLIGWPDDGADGALARELTASSLTNPLTNVTAASLFQAASLETVRWIEPVGQPRLLNDYARTIMQVGPVWQNHGLFGAGQIVGIADSGLDTGDLVTMTLSPDFAGRIVATHVFSPTGDWGDNFGHGTHVAGSLAGAGVQSGAITATHSYSGSFAGIAPEASLVIQAFEVVDFLTGEFVGLDPDYYTLFDQAYADGARLHSDSWGDFTGPVSDTEAAYGGYPFGAQRTDEFLWDHPDVAIFSAAGNESLDGVPGALGFCTGGDGVVDPDSLLSPATAKNVISVGASESNRSAGGLGFAPWFFVNLCFVTDPIATDTVADDANGMAAFSSRGPTDDGRIKPDLVAPGTNIVSNKSHYPGATMLWWPHETNPDYVYSGGTSMATPLTAGLGALVREWLITQGLANPSGAAIKATLLNTTHDNAPGQYGEDTTQEVPYARPNSVAGWGRADLGFVVAPAPYVFWIDDQATGLTTGQPVSYTDTEARPLEVTDSAQPMRLMLTWTDPPASLSAATQLVNDLDLTVTGPGGVTYYGNGVIGGDRLNNVEGIVIENPPLGQYTVLVSGFNVPIASQPFALAVGGPMGDATPTPTSTPGPSPTPTGTATPTGTPPPGLLNRLYLPLLQR